MSFKKFWSHSFRAFAVAVSSYTLSFKLLYSYVLNSVFTIDLSCELFPWCWFSTCQL